MRDLDLEVGLHTLDGLEAALDVCLKGSQTRTKFDEAVVRGIGPVEELLNVAIQTRHGVFNFMVALDLLRLVVLEDALQLVHLTHHVGVELLEVIVDVLDLEVLEGFEVDQMWDLLQRLGHVGVDLIQVKLLTDLRLGDVQLHAVALGVLLQNDEVALQLADLADHEPAQVAQGAVLARRSVSPRVCAGWLGTLVEVVRWHQRRRVAARRSRTAALRRRLAPLPIVGHGSQIQRIAAGLGTRLRYHRISVIATKMSCARGRIEKAPTTLDFWDTLGNTWGRH